MELDWSSLKLIRNTPKKQISVRGRRSALKRYRLEEIRDDRRRVERSWTQTPHTRGASSEHLRKEQQKRHRPRQLRRLQNTHERRRDPGTVARFF